MDKSIRITRGDAIQMNGSNMNDMVNSPKLIQVLQHVVWGGTQRASIKELASVTGKNERMVSYYVSGGEAKAIPASWLKSISDYLIKEYDCLDVLYYFLPAGWRYQ